MKRYSAIDLFAGCGGLSLGLERAGFDVRVAVEIDRLAADTYKQNHSKTKILQKDICSITPEELIQASGIQPDSLDLLAGCPPCQGFSRIKRKNKPDTNDPRNELIFEYLRLAKALRPKVILLENVPALGNDERFRKVVRTLRAMKYVCDWGVLNAADFGVPQRRKRFIMMATRVGTIKVPIGSEAHRTVREYIYGLERPKVAKDSLQRMHLNNSPRIKTLISKIPKDGGSRAALGKHAQLGCHKRTRGFNDVYGRMKWDAVAPTLTGGCFNPSKGRYLHPTQNRPITLREAALLQSFPATYHFPTLVGLSAVARMIGDALPPAFGEAQGRHLVKVLQEYGQHD